MITVMSGLRELQVQSGVPMTRLRGYNNLWRSMHRRAEAKHTLTELTTLPCASAGLAARQQTRTARTADTLHLCMILKNSECGCVTALPPHTITDRWPAGQ